MKTARFYIHFHPQQQRVPLLLHALLQGLFLAAINAGVTADSDIDHNCEILSKLAIDQRERSLAREFFHRDQKMGENDEEYAWNLQLLAEIYFKGCPPARVTNWLVEAATRKRQGLLLTSARQTNLHRPNPPRPRWTFLRQKPRAGEAYYLLSCQPPNASRPFLQDLGKLEGYPCRFLLDSGAVKSLVNPKAFPDLFCKFRARPSTIKLLSAERSESPLKVTVGKESWTVQFITCPELVWDVILGADFLRTTRAILNFAECTFTAQQHKATKSVEPSPGKDADEICSALFEAAGIPVNILDELCSRLTHITDSERKELHSLLRGYSRMFAWQGTKLGRTDIIKHAIDTGEAKPIWQAPRRIPPPLLEDVNHLVNEMIVDDVIRPSKSPWASPIALVRKSDGSLRLCIDYRKLNAVTKKDAFPLPHINGSLNSLYGANWFFSLGLKSGYWQVEVAETDREKTAFIVPNGLYEFQTTPFGLCNAAATFQRLMQTALMGLFLKHCIIYLDDILVFGRDMQEHNANLKLVLDRLRDAGLTLSPKKCHFLQRSVTFLGYTVSSNGMAVTEDRTNQVRTWPTPTNQT
ncbi:Retrovirus-related Pol polyprotein from transposon [Taenia solium]|eukprot:TsM_000037400 transcript=TsM_000037400 gene=TsM_000037400